MKCYVCEADKFKEIEKIHSQSKIVICQVCGNCAHLKEPADEQKMLDYYRKEYRAAPDYRNLVTTAHKQFYIQLFLAEFLTKAKTEKRVLVCGDVGSATGYIPNFLRRNGHKATGCELTLTFRRFSEHFYGIPLTEELETKHKYDLITIYHVLEHMIEPDKKLAHYVSLLSDGGHIMVSTPEWFYTLEESSGKAFEGFEGFFAKDHINLFSKQSIHNLFSKCGLVIEKEDHIQYGQTYLLRKAVPNEKTEIILHENPVTVEENLWKQKKASDLFMQKKFREAIDMWPCFPDAWLHWILDVHGKEPNEQTRLFEEAKKHLENNARTRLSLGIWCYQQQKYKEALELFSWVMNYRPSEDIVMYMGWCHSIMGNKKEAMNAFFKCAEMNPQKWIEAMNWVCAEASKMPTWDERAMEELKNQIASKVVQKPQLVDPHMDGAEWQGETGKEAIKEPVGGNGAEQTANKALEIH